LHTYYTVYHHSMWGLDFLLLFISKLRVLILKTVQPFAVFSVNIAGLFWWPAAGRTCPVCLHTVYMCVCVCSVINEAGNDILTMSALVFHRATRQQPPATRAAAPAALKADDTWKQQQNWFYLWSSKAPSAPWASVLPEVRNLVLRLSLNYKQYTAVYEALVISTSYFNKCSCCEAVKGL